MPVTNAPREWTAEMVRALPDDGNRYEVLDGELFVTPAPSPPHQFVLAELFIALHPFVRAHGLGHLVWSPADVEFSPRRLVQPDLFLAPSSAGRVVSSWKDLGTPILVIEALSPSTALADRNRKRTIYQSHGVSEYWIVDTDARLIERWTGTETRPEVITSTFAWSPAGAGDSLEIDVVALFAAVDKALGQ